jgi:TRAP transporter TAXI family solute receptor
MTEAPFIDRKLELHFQGDWGWANLHRICGWLASEVLAHSASGTRIAVWTGGAGIDAVEAVASGQMHMSAFVPASFAPMALDGRGYFNGKAFPNLRALGTMPQTDPLVLAIPARYGIKSFADFRAKRPALRIACSLDDGNNTLGYGVQTIMAASGIPRATLEAWGGGYVEGGPPHECIGFAQDGKADAVFYEAFMTPYWKKFADTHELNFIPVEDEVLDRLERTLGWRRQIVPAGYQRGIDAPFATVDFSDFLMITRDDLDDEVAYLLAWAMCETKEILERQYRHLPGDRSPVTWPLDPRKIAATSIPLHAGAARYYRQAGLI